MEGVIENMFWIKLAAFFFATGGLASISRASFRHPRSHGFPRFFACELLVILFLVNVDYWVWEPFSLLQIISWMLLILSLVLIITGMITLVSKGEYNEKRVHDGLIKFEKTTTLVKTGIYHFIRHPMYSSLLFLGWGIFFKSPTWLTGILVSGVTVFLVVTAKFDEVEDINFFGTAYQDYMKRTKMFIPFIF